MNSLHQPRLGVWLARLAVVGLAGACGETVELESTERPGVLVPTRDLDAGLGFDGGDAQAWRPDGDAAVVGDAGQLLLDDAGHSYAQVLVHADRDAASFTASASATIMLQLAEPSCTSESIGSCTVYSCGVRGGVPAQVLSGVRVLGSLGECALGINDATTGTVTCQASLWDFDKPSQTLTVVNAPGVGPAFRADLVLPTGATLSEPSNMARLARTATRFAWSGGTAGGVELTLRGEPGCAVTTPEPSAVCNAPAYAGELELPSELFTRLTDVPCLRATLRTVSSTSASLSGYRLDVRAELDLAGSYTFVEP